MAETSQTLDRGLRALTLIASAEKGLSVTELASQLGVGRTVAHRLLATLELHGLVRRDSSSKARPGFGLLPLAAQVQPLLRESAIPVLRELAEAVGATAHLSVLDGNEAVAVAVVEPSWTDYHVAYRLGSRHPAELGAGGRALTTLSGQWVVSSGELQPGAHGIAARLPSGPGLVASIGVVALSELDAAVVGPQVIGAARSIAARLVDGWAG